MTDLNQQKSKLHTHAEVDEENTDDIVYEADKGAASGSAPAGNGKLQATDPASANLVQYAVFTKPRAIGKGRNQYIFEWNVFKSLLDGIGILIVQ